MMRHMKNQTINDVANDPMGAAIMDFHRNGKADTLKVMSSMFEDDEIPLETLFRRKEEMPEIEQIALEMASGRILDIGAGSGCHSLALQEMQKDVTAIDISPLSIEVMRERGVKKAVIQDFFAEDFREQYDTLLMLMNGTGIIGKMKNIGTFFAKARQLMAPGAQILVDSSDLAYIFEDEDGFFDTTEFDNYYGEIDFQMQYRNIIGEPFDWLYIDYETLEEYAAKYGFQAELVKEGEHYEYLAKLTSP